MAAAMSIVKKVVDEGVPYPSHQLYEVTFFEDTIATTVTDTTSVVDAWITETVRILQSNKYPPVVGLDVKWLSRRLEKHVATVQLCVERRCLIFQIMRSEEVPFSLKNFLEDGSYTFSNIWIYSQKHSLWKDYGLKVEESVDLRVLAFEKDGADDSLSLAIEELARKFLKREIKRTPREILRLSSWYYKELSSEQVQYACIDAFLGFEMARILTSSTD